MSVEMFCFVVKCHPQHSSLPCLQGLFSPFILELMETNMFVWHCHERRSTCNMSLSENQYERAVLFLAMPQKMTVVRHSQ